MLPAEERAALLAARHRPNAALQVLSQVIESAGLRETQVAPLLCSCACRAAATQEGDCACAAARMQYGIARSRKGSVAYSAMAPPAPAGDPHG